MTQLIARRPAGICPGQRMMHGTRTPPSNVVSLPSRNGVGAAGVVAVGEERAVVGDEDDQRVVVQAVLLQRREHLADGPVEFFDHVAVEPARGLAP